MRPFFLQHSNGGQSNSGIGSHLNLENGFIQQLCIKLPSLDQAHFWHWTKEIHILAFM